jgi:acyl carrier protein
MELQEFVRNFATQFEDIDVTFFREDTKFRDIEEWSSLTALFIIGMVNEKYRIKINNDDIKKAQTIEDLFKIVISKKK